MIKKAIVDHLFQTLSSRKERLMPKVPEYNHKPLKPLYKINDPNEYATMKQKNYITIMCEKRKLPVPHMKYMKKGEAAQIISNMTGT